MTTYRQLIYLVLDELKVTSDDSFIQPEHVLLLLDHYRTFILKQRYNDIKKEVPTSNLQTITLSLRSTKKNTKSCLESIDIVPSMLTIYNPKISTVNMFDYSISYVSRDRFPYVGNNKYLQNIIYATIGYDNHLYLTSFNIQCSYLTKIKVTGIFENSSEVNELISLEDGNTGDLLDNAFPLEEGLIPTVVELIVKELSGTLYRPKDDDNNASDDLSKVHVSND